MLTYIAEARTETSKIKRQIHMTEMSILRRTVGKAWGTELCGITNVTEWIMERWQLWNKHLSRMDHNRLVQIVRDNIAQESWKTKRR